MSGVNFLNKTHIEKLSSRRLPPSLLEANALREMADSFAEKDSIHHCLPHATTSCREFWVFGYLLESKPAITFSSRAFLTLGKAVRMAWHLRSQKMPGQSSP
jgi:hypothetical protein